MARRLIGLGEYHASERHLAVLPAAWSPDDAAPLCIVAHGWFSDAWSYLPRALHQDLEILAEAGFVVVAADLGGQSTWGNQTFLSRADSLISWAVTKFGVDTTRVSWIADSMGAAGALNWCARHPPQVGAVVLRLAAVNLDELVVRDDPAGIAGAIAAAHGNDWPVARPLFDPALNTALVARFAERILVEWSTDDPVMQGDDATYGEGLDAAVLPMGPTAHDVALFYPAIPGRYQAQFIRHHHFSTVTLPELMVGTEEDRWLDLALTGAPFVYRGGDITDSVELPGGEVVWVGSDLFVGSVSGDVFTGTPLPNDNGIIVADADQSWSHQVYRTGTSGIAMLPTQAERIYWPLACCLDGGMIRIACALVDRSVGIYGSRVDSHIVTLNPADVLAGSNINIVSVTAVGSDTEIFDVMGLTPGEDGWVYVTGGEFIPPFTSGYGLGDLTQSVVRHRIARAPAGQLTNVAAWRYWDGSGWVAGQANAVPITDHDGDPIEGGDFGICRLGDDDWLGVDHQLVSDSVRYWRASGPEGPWHLRGDVPVPDFGRKSYSGDKIGQFARPAPHVPMPSGYVAAFLVPNILNGSGAGLGGQLVRFWTPRFVAIPV